MGIAAPTEAPPTAPAMEGTGDGVVHCVTLPGIAVPGITEPGMTPGCHVCPTDIAAPGTCPTDICTPGKLAPPMAAAMDAPGTGMACPTDMDAPGTARAPGMPADICPPGKLAPPMAAAMDAPGVGMACIADAPCIVVCKVAPGMAPGTVACIVAPGTTVVDPVILLICSMDKEPP